MGYITQNLRVHLHEFAQYGIPYLPTINPNSNYIALDSGGPGSKILMKKPEVNKKV